MPNHEVEIKDILDFHCPRYKELPMISLYKDQVISYVEETLKPLNLHPMERLLTPTMLNNYVKQRVVSPPHNRRYNEKHLAYLIVVCLLKQVYSLTEICELIKIQIDTCPIEEAYDSFCLELEKSLRLVFSSRESIHLNSDKKLTIEAELVQSVVTSVSYKLFTQKCLIDRKR